MYFVVILFTQLSSLIPFSGKEKYCILLLQDFRKNINSQWDNPKGYVHLTDSVHLTDAVHLTDTIHLTDFVHLTDSVHLTDTIHLTETFI